MRKRDKETIFLCYEALGKVISRNGKEETKAQDMERLENVAWALRRIYEGFPKRAEALAKELGGKSDGH